MSRRQADKIMGIIFLPIIWPGVLFMWVAEKLSDKYSSGPRPEMLIGIGCWVVIGLFWWVVNQFF